MTGRVAWYAHHHGRGHLARAAAVVPHLDARVTVLTSAPDPPRELDVLALPLDLPGAGEPGVPPPPPGLHHAPVRAASLRERMRILAAFLAREAPDVLVVDVSVEVALFARLCGVPVAIVRQHGDRTDPPHRLAYAWADLLLAPYPEWLEDASAPEAVRRATFYAGGFARGTPARGQRPVPGRVVVLSGGGDDGFAPEDVRAAEAACPGTEWHLAGPGHWRDDVAALLASAEVVVAHGGHNAVMEVAAAGRPLVCIPRPRPFGEQHGKACALEREGAAVVCDGWPATQTWPALLRAARDLGSARLARAVDRGAAARFAGAVDDLAAGLRSGDAGAGDLGGRRLPQDLEALALGLP